MRNWLLVVLAVFVCLASVPARGVIIYGKAGRNTAAPKGILANSGWQYQGDWGGFSGVPIAPNYFVTASHVGGNVGTSFNYGAGSFTTTAYFDDPNSDLRIYKIDGDFPTYAPLYTNVNEKRHQAVIFGRGTERGAEIRIGKRFKGWEWGEQDGVRAWGTNVVSEVGRFGLPKGNFLQFQFNPGVGPNEGVISAGDSGGGVFIKDHGTWKLAGINYSVDDPFSLTGQDGTGFNAAVIDEGGFYEGGDGAWQLMKDVSRNIPQSMYATRISTESGWINSVLEGTVSPTAGAADVASSNVVPEPAGAIVVIGVGAILMLARRKKGGRFTPARTA